MVALHPLKTEDPRQDALSESLSKRRSLRLTSLVGLHDARAVKGDIKLNLSRVAEAQDLQEQPLEQSAFGKKYVLGEVLGVGAMSRVRVATARCGNRKVAVKCVDSEEEDLRQVTHAEYKLMSTLRFPSIVQVEGFYETPGRLLMCMELCENGCLESYVKKQQLGESKAVDLFSQLIAGVNYLHLHRIVHRDLKPANLLLTNDATILKITDFNSAKRIGGCEGSSLMLTDRGTHLYSAPELRFGRQWNERVDIWAIGLSFYYMLRAELPFNIQDQGDATILRSGKLPMFAWWTFTDMVRNLLLQCLTVDPHDRPPAMELMMHPIFGNKCLYTDRLPPPRDATNHQAELSGFVRNGHGQSYLPSCGLLLMSVYKRVGTENVSRDDTQRNLASRCHPLEASSIEGWKERRSGVDALQRLANNRCMRIEENKETFHSRETSISLSPGPSIVSSSGECHGFSRSPSPKSHPSPTSKSNRQKKDMLKFFTTHGAVQID